MVVQVIESRYTVDYDVLVVYLKSIFEPNPFEIIVCAFKESNESALLTQALSYLMKARNGRSTSHES